MDPFTLTTGIITLLGACSTTSKTLAKIRSLREAPTLIQALNNEISDLHLILLDVSEHYGSTEPQESIVGRGDEPVFKLCSATLENTRSQVQEVEALLRDRLLKHAEGTGLKINRRAFWQEYNHLLQLQTDLRHARQRMAGLFGHLGVRKISRIEVLLNDIQSNDLSVLIQGQSRIESTLDRIAKRQMTLDSSHQVPQDASSQNLNSLNPASVQVSVSRLNTPLQQLECKCHRHSSRQHFRTFLGQLFVGYVAFPAAGQGHHKCPFHHKTELRLVYLFPNWCLKYAFSLHAILNTSHTVTCSLSVRQRIPENHVVLDYIERGELQGLKDILASGQLSLEAQLLHTGGLLSVRSRCIVFKAALWLIVAETAINLEGKRCCN